MKNNIILIGMMGSGKSTLSHLLYKKTGYNIIDTDDIIERNEKKPIKEIFKEYGEGFFRNLEEELLKTADYDACIISTGGGMILSESNRSALKKLGHVFYLRGTVGTLFERLIHATEDRPLINGDELRDQLEKLLDDRADLYMETADSIIDIDLKTADDIILEIYTILKDLDYKFLP